MILYYKVPLGGRQD